MTDTEYKLICILSARYGAPVGPSSDWVDHVWSLGDDCYLVCDAWDCWYVVHRDRDIELALDNRGLDTTAAFTEVSHAQTATLALRAVRRKQV